MGSTQRWRTLSSGHTSMRFTSRLSTRQAWRQIIWPLRLAWQSALQATNSLLCTIGRHCPCMANCITQANTWPYNEQHGYNWMYNVHSNLNPNVPTVTWLHPPEKIGGRGNKVSWHRQLWIYLQTHIALYLVTTNPQILYLLQLWTYGGRHKTDKCVVQVTWPLPGPQITRPPRGQQITRPPPGQQITRPPPKLQITGHHLGRKLNGHRGRKLVGCHQGCLI